MSLTIAKNTSGGFGPGADLTINGKTNGRGSVNISTNIADGYQALQNNTTGKENLAIVYQALQNIFLKRMVILHL